MTVNVISSEPLFLKTCLYQTLKEHPLGFIDIGAMGAIHPIISPISSLTHVVCFEPHTEEQQKLIQKYAEHPYKELTILNSAISSDNKAKQPLHIAKNSNNSSLLFPHRSFMERYNLDGVVITHSENVRTETLDQIYSRSDSYTEKMGEFLKIDAQGLTYEVLMGSSRLLTENCKAVWCEVEFTEIYTGQKKVSDVVKKLEEYGFCWFGLYPGYLSNKMLDRRRHETAERIVWADAFFFKDPLDEINQQRKFTTRDIHVLIVVAVITKYYDYALELTSKFIDDPKDRLQIEKFIKHVAKIDQGALMESVKDLSLSCQNDPENVYLHIHKFISSHKSHSDLNFLLKSGE